MKLEEATTATNDLLYHFWLKESFDRREKEKREECFTLFFSSLLGFTRIVMNMVSSYCLFNYEEEKDVCNLKKGINYRNRNKLGDW